jgi:hypothetical protein
MNRLWPIAILMVCGLGCSKRSNAPANAGAAGFWAVAGNSAIVGTGGLPGQAGASVVGAGSGGVVSVAGAGGMAGISLDAGSTGGRGGAGGGAGATGTGGTMSVPDAGSTAVRPAVIQFTPGVRINDDTGTAQQTEVMIAARPDGLVLAGFIDYRNRPSSCGFSVSRDGGKTWGKNFFALTMGGSSGFAGDPSVAIDDAGNLYAVCQDYGSPTQILFSTSTDSGGTWTPFKVINQSQDKPWIGAARDGTLFLTWLGSPGGYKRSLDHGQTWESVISLGNLVHGTGISPGSTGVVHIAYNQGNSVRYLRSDDWGATLGMGRNLVDQGSACFEPCSPRSHPIIGTGADPTGKIVAITWASTATGGDGNDDVWVLVSQDTGQTFSKPIRANDNPIASPSRQFEPWVAVDRYGRVHAVWTDFRNGGKNDVYYASMTDPAKGFEKNIKVNDATGNAPSFLGDYKGIAIQGDDVIVAWQDTRNDTGDIYFARAVGAAAK